MVRRLVVEAPNIMFLLMNTLSSGTATAENTDNKMLPGCYQLQIRLLACSETQGKFTYQMTVYLNIYIVQYIGRSYFCLMLLSTSLHPNNNQALFWEWAWDFSAAEVYQMPWLRAGWSLTVRTLMIQSQADARCVRQTTDPHFPAYCWSSYCTGGCFQVISVLTRQAKSWRVRTYVSTESLTVQDIAA